MTLSQKPACRSLPTTSVGSGLLRMRAVARRRQGPYTPTTLNRNRRVWAGRLIHPLAPAGGRWQQVSGTICPVRGPILDFSSATRRAGPHPVRWIGNLITLTQRIVRRYCHSDRAARWRRARWLTVVGLTWLLSGAY